MTKPPHPVQSTTTVNHTLNNKVNFKPRKKREQNLTNWSKNWNQNSSHKPFESIPWPRQTFPIWRNSSKLPRFDPHTSSRLETWRTQGSFYNTRLISHCWHISCTAFWIKVHHGDKDLYEGSDPTHTGLFTGWSKSGKYSGNETTIWKNLGGLQRRCDLASYCSRRRYGDPTIGNYYTKL